MEDRASKHHARSETPRLLFENYLEMSSFSHPFVQCLIYSCVVFLEIWEGIIKQKISLRLGG